ncbi:hypothetical protein [Streptomyces venezuelae]|uniref:hypothetical protein n=1 Tax=Streptomyces venezuelae TaxID=54571 RepID=UPI00363AFE4C
MTPLSHGVPARRRTVFGLALPIAATSSAPVTTTCGARRTAGKAKPAVAPGPERFETERAGSRTVETDCSHVAMTSRPERVVGLIDEAAVSTC